MFLTICDTMSLVGCTTLYKCHWSCQDFQVIVSNITHQRFTKVMQNPSQNSLFYIPGPIQHHSVFQPLDFLGHYYPVLWHGSLPSDSGNFKIVLKYQRARRARSLVDKLLSQRALWLFFMTWARIQRPAVLHRIIRFDLDNKLKSISL